MAKASGTVKRKRASHKNGGVNKAQAIRDAASEIGGKVRPKEVIAALAAKGITVSSPQVSSTLKAAGYRRTRRRGRSTGTNSSGAPSKNGSSRMPSLENLLAAKALVSKLGSIEAAKKALDVLVKLG